MRIGQTIAIVLIWVLLVFAACGKPASVTPASLVTPTTPATPPTTPPATPPLTTPPTPLPPTPTFTPTPGPPPPTIPPAVRGPYEVWVQTREFKPMIMTVPVGTKLTWTNKDSEGHTVTSDTGLFNGPVGPFGGSFSYTFTERGNYEYHCDPHPDMVGKIVVE